MKEVKLRRFENLLVLSGSGVIIFGLWSCVKAVLGMIFKTDDIVEAFGGDVFVRFLVIFIYIVIGIFLLIDLGLRVFIGLSARREGLGKKKSFVYVIFAILLTIASSYSTVDTIISEFQSTETLLEMLVTVFVEITSLIVMIEMIVSAFVVKKLRKELKEA